MGQTLGFLLQEPLWESVLYAETKILKEKKGKLRSHYLLSSSPTAPDLLAF